ncbi:MAG: carboxyl transferase domain-containing protein, partial [Propionicimonas sp.]
MELEIHTTRGKVAQLGERIEQARNPSPQAAVEKVHAQGKLTARERVLKLLDEGTFTEFDEFSRHRSTMFGLEEKRPYTDGVITGVG